jgi:hypothetical protein
MGHQHHNATDLFTLMQTSLKTGLRDKIGQDALPPMIVAALLRYADAKVNERNADRAVTNAVAEQEGVGAAISTRGTREEESDTAFNELLELSGSLAGQRVSEAEFKAAAENAKQHIDQELGLRGRTGRAAG